MALSVGEIQATLTLQDLLSPAVKSAAAITSAEMGKISTAAMSAKADVASLEKQWEAFANVPAAQAPIATALGEATIKAQLLQQQLSGMKQAINDSLKPPDEPDALPSFLSRIGNSFVARVAEGMLLRDAIREVLSVVKSLAEAFPNLLEHTVAVGDSLFNMSVKTGASVEGLSALRYVASQTGVNFDSFSTTLSMMERNLGATGAAGKNVSETLGRMGLDLTTVKNMRSDEAFLAIAKALEGVTNNADKAHDAQLLMGRGAKEMAALWHEDISGMMQDARDLGLVMSTETAAGAHLAEIGFQALRMQVEALGMHIANAFIPAIIGVENDLGIGLTNAVKELNAQLGATGGSGGFLATVAQAMGTGDAAIAAQIKLYDDLKGALIGMVRIEENVVTAIGWAMAGFDAAVVVIARVEDGYYRLAIASQYVAKAQLELARLGTSGEERQVYDAEIKIIDETIKGYGLEITANQQRIAAKESAEGEWVAWAASANSQIEIGLNAIAAAHTDVGKKITEMAAISRGAAGGFSDDLDGIGASATAAEKSIDKAGQLWDEYFALVAKGAGESLAHQLDEDKKWYDGKLTALNEALAKETKAHAGHADELRALKEASNNELEALNAVYWQKDADAIKAALAKVEESTTATVGNIQRELGPASLTTTSQLSAMFRQLQLDFNGLGRDTQSFLSDAAIPKGMKDAGVAVNELIGSLVEGSFGGGGAGYGSGSSGSHTLEGALKASYFGVDALKDKTSTLTSTIGSLATALSQLAQVSGDTWSSMVRDLAKAVVGMDAVVKAKDAFNAQGANFGDKAASIATIGASALSEAETISAGAKGESGAMGALGGAAQGALFGAAFGGVGAAVGAVIGGAIGAISAMTGPTAQEKLTRTTRDDFMKQFQGQGDSTGIQTLGDDITALGVSATEAQQQIGAMLDARTPEAFDAAMAKINVEIKQVADIAKGVTGVQSLVGAFENAGHVIPASMLASLQSLKDMKGLTDAEKTSIQGLIDGAKPNFEDLKGKAAALGITLEALGPQFEQGDLNQKAEDVWQTIQDLINAAGPNALGGILSSTMTDASGKTIGLRTTISDLVNESKKFGTTIPDNMKPYIQNLIDAGLLTDSAGNKVKDMSGIKFAPTMQTALDTMNTALATLTKFLKDLPSIIAGIPTIDLGSLDVNGYDANNSLKKKATGFAGGGVVPDYFAGGGTVPSWVFRPKGTDTVPAMLTPGETVLTPTQLAALRGGDAGDMTVSTTVMLDGEVLGRYMDRRSKRSFLLRQKAPAN